MNCLLSLGTSPSKIGPLLGNRDIAEAVQADREQTNRHLIGAHVFDGLQRLPDGWGSVDEIGGEFAIGNDNHAGVNLRFAQALSEVRYVAIQHHAATGHLDLHAEGGMRDG